MNPSDDAKFIAASIAGYAGDLKVNMIAGIALNGFYLALILKKLSGIEITEDIENQVKNEIVRQFEDFCTRAYAAEQSLSRTKGREQS